MAGPLGHVPLAEAAAFKMRRRAGGRRSPYGRTERDYGEFRRTAAQKLRELDDNRRDDAKRYAQYGYTPAPIFRLGLTQSVPCAGFRKSLESVDIETVSSATEGLGYWVVAGGKNHAGRLDRQIERRAASESPTFIDAIEAFAEAEPSGKLGRSLRRRPIKGGPELADVEVWRLKDDALEAFAGQLLKIVEGNGGEITDMHKTHDSFVVQIACSASLLSTVASLREVVRMDRPLQAGAV